jgi:hypothetical protein
VFSQGGSSEISQNPESPQNPEEQEDPDVFVESGSPEILQNPEIPLNPEDQEDPESTEDVYASSGDDEAEFQIVEVPMPLQRNGNYAMMLNQSTQTGMFTLYRFLIMIEFLKSPCYI